MYKNQHVSNHPPTEEIKKCKILEKVTVTTHGFCSNFFSCVVDDVQYFGSSCLNKVIVKIVIG